MKEKLIFCIAIILIISLYFYGASNSPNNGNNSKNREDDGIKFENTLATNDHQQPPQRIKLQFPTQDTKTSKKTGLQSQNQSLQTSQSVEAVNSYKTNNNYVSPEEIQRRERAAFEDLKRQQYNKQINRTSVTYNNTNNKGIDSYLLGNMAIDKPPTGEQMQAGSSQTREYYIKQNLEKGDLVIPINQPTALSYKSKQEVFNERKKYVSESIFAYPNYEPDEKTLGQIEDGKPWISTNLCLNADKSTRVNGLSEESRFLNNPSILVGIEDAYMHTLPNGADNDPICHEILLPEKARYIKSENVIEVTYKSVPVATKQGFSYGLNGLNARDFGYEYARFDNNKSKNVFMENFNSIASEVIQFKNFIHKGGACRVQGGCNNGSPHQPKLHFFYPDPSLETVMYIKLWRKMPKDYMQPADINEKIIILPK